MRVVGIIGGMSCVSTAIYYDRLNALVRNRLGGLHSARCVIWSVDFAEIEAMQAQGRWEDAAEVLKDAARRLELAGAEVIVLATNTMHKVAPAIMAATRIPFLHIADATAERIRAAGLKRPGLIATAYTMEQDFYAGRLRDGHGLDVIVPDTADRAEIHRIIYEELCCDIVNDGSRRAFETIAAKLVSRGADSVILGCTEVGMLLSAQNVPVPVFDTTLIHVEAAAEFSLARFGGLAAA